MRADLHDGASLDELGNFFPLLAVRVEPVEEQLMLFGGPATSVFKPGTGLFLGRRFFFGVATTTAIVVAVMTLVVRVGRLGAQIYLPTETPGPAKTAIGLAW